jgi:hypothetical protein
MQKKHIFNVIFWHLLASVIVLVGIFYAFPALSKKNDQTATHRVAIRVWNVDTFEGGKGSRTVFLKAVANEYAKQNVGQYVLVSSYTKEGAKQAMDGGDFPDILSFGVGFCPPIERCLKLAAPNFGGGAVGGDTLAYPWCRGGYALFTKNGDFSSVTAQNTVLSQGGENLIAVAAASLGIEKAQSAPSTTAYVQFLNGKYEYLLGTQRDANRFLTRGVDVQCRPLEDFCDLYQYVCVLSNENEQASKGFLSLLFSKKTQTKLFEIGMISLDYTQQFETGALNDMQKVQANYTLGAFLDDNALARIKDLAQENPEQIKNFLKRA